MGPLSPARVADRGERGVTGPGRCRRFVARRAFILLVLFCAILVLPSAFSDTSWLPPGEPARTYAERALRTQRFTLSRLANLPRLEQCGRLPFIGYERNDGSPLSDAWYNAAQLQADAALARLGQPDRSCVLRKTAAFFDLLRAPAPPGGYYPRADVDGRNLSDQHLYADDTALIGLALLEARDASRDEVWRATLLDQARHAARLLTDEGLWDETFGGGIWWNSRRGLSAEGKPSQTTALAAQLFLRLYEATGEQRYADWARACLRWLEARLVDPSTDLYFYTIRYWDMARQQGEYRESALYSYDQGIMIEVHLLAERLLEPGGTHLARARELAIGLQAAFWDPELGGYRISTDRPDVSAGYGAWVTQSLLALDAADPNPLWLSWARANLDALESHLVEDPREGYANLYYRCIDRERIGCEDGQVWTYDPTRYLISQAWMQRAQALLAARLAGPG